MSQAAAASVRVTAIVPVLRDNDALIRLISDLKALSRLPDRIIVVSGCRDEQLTQIAREHELMLMETPASRGLQLDTGARATDTEVLWFIHADARIPVEACEAIVTAIGNGASGGCLRFVLQGNPTAFKRSLEWLVRLRVACGGMAYGDQALFCTRDAYIESGGFPHRPLFEEVPLVRYLRKKRSFVALSLPVFVATRRWECDGWLRRSLHNRWLALRHFLGASPERLAAAYRKRSNRQHTTSNHSNATETQG